jgi:hypothetical protein
MNELIAVEKIAQWQKLKALALDSVSAPITNRVYNMALNEFMEWVQPAPRPLHQGDRERAVHSFLQACGRGVRAPDKGHCRPRLLGQGWPCAPLSTSFAARPNPSMSRRREASIVLLLYGRRPSISIR